MAIAGEVSCAGIDDDVTDNKSSDTPDELYDYEEATAVFCSCGELDDSGYWNEFNVLCLHNLWQKGKEYSWQRIKLTAFKVTGFKRELG